MFGYQGLSCQRVVRILAAAFLIVGLSTVCFAADPLRVFYAGPPGGVSQALGLSRTIQLEGDAAQADVLVLNGVIPPQEAISRRVREGAGLVLIMGPTLSAREVSGLLGVPVAWEVKKNAESIDKRPGLVDPLVTEIIWNSSPQVRERATVSGLTLVPIVQGYADQQTILGRMRLGQGTVYVFTPFLDDKTNPQIQQWAYFNYLVYHLVVSAHGARPDSYADYPASPVPHKRERLGILAFLALLLVSNGGIFLLVRRYSKAHPEALDVLVSDRVKYEIREAGTEWEDIGFHRPLGGFMLALMLGLILFVPLIIYQNLILPVYILPSAQALGLWGRVTQFFNVAWLLFDMGTSTAFIKFLSEHRVNDPRRGIQYGQMFVWWQILSGAFQVTLIIALTSTFIPQSVYAIYTWSMIIHTLIQVPGCYMLLRHSLTGLQRFDYAQILDLAQAVILPMIVQPLIVIPMYLWGQSHPVFGSSMGGLLGMGMAAYAAEGLTFAAGFLLYRRLGYSVKILFMAHFDWQIVKTSLSYGVFEMLGSIAWAAGQAAEIWITQERLVNYTEIWGNWVLAQNFVFSYTVLATLYSNLMPSMSESISHGRKILSQYYSVQAYKFGGLISFFLGAILLAVADRFILGASGPEFERAALYAIPLVIWGAFQYPSWVGDNVQLAANRPYLKSMLVFGEQVIRITLALILVERFQINGLIIAYFVGLFTKNIVAYLINHRVCFPQRFYVWQSLIAPLLAGAVIYVFLRWLGGIIWKADQISSVLLFFVGTVPAVFCYAFLYAFFGGWDDETLDELKQGAALANFVRPIAWFFWASSALGARFSPLHGRFPINIRHAALAEAKALTRERVKI